MAELRITEDVPLTADLLPLLRLLRPNLTDESVAELATDGPRFLVGYSPSGLPLALAGYRVLVTSRGRILYVDDLVTAVEARSRGIGAEVMAALVALARRHECVRLELDSGVTNHAAHRFYLRHELDIVAFHFAINVV